MNRKPWLIPFVLLLSAFGLLAAFSLCHQAHRPYRTSICPPQEDIYNKVWQNDSDAYRPQSHFLDTLHFLHTDNSYEFRQGETRRWNPLVADALDPFGGAQQFIIHFENFSSDDWCYPLPGAHVISPYGERGERQHAGTDIKTFPGDSVRAAFGGVVVMSELFSTYGNCVQLRHGNGLTTLYSHNAHNLVAPGDYVRAGQVIALEGGTGRATTEHVHFEVRVGDRQYDSGLIFDHDGNTLCRHAVVFNKGENVTIIALGN